MLSHVHIRCKWLCLCVLYFRWHCSILRHRAWTYSGTQRLQPPFRIQSSATTSPDEKKRKIRATTQTSPNHSFKRVDRTESSKEAMPSCQEWVRSQLALHLPLLTTLQLYHFQPLSPSSQWLFLPVHSMPAPVCQRLYCTPVHFKVLHCKIENVPFFVFVLHVLFVW